MMKKFRTAILVSLSVSIFGTASNASPALATFPNSGISYSGEISSMQDDGVFYLTGWSDPFKIHTALINDDFDGGIFIGKEVFCIGIYPAPGTSDGLEVTLENPIPVQCTFIRAFSGKNVLAVLVDFDMAVRGCLKDLSGTMDNLIECE